MIFHIAGLWILSNALAKPMKLAYTVAFHSLLCSIICVSVKIWSAHDLPLRNPACSLRGIGSTMSLILFKMTLQWTLLVMARRILPLQLSVSVRSPFLGRFTIRPIFHWFGTVSQMSVSALGVTTFSSFSISVYIWS